MEIRFLGAANTVTGSQFLLITDRARVLIDCGMFQGGPHEVVRNRVPLAYDPATLNAIVLTHAHLDHCGLIPHIVAEGFTGPIYSTRGTADLAALVLLDSGKLQEEYAKRHKHWAAKNPDKAAREDARETAQIVEEEIQAEIQDESLAIDAVTGKPIGPQAGDLTAGGDVVASGVDELVLRDEQGLGTRMGFPPFGHPNHEAAITGSPDRPNLVLEEPVYDLAQATSALTHFRPVSYEAQVAVAPGVTAVFHDAGHILGSSIVEFTVVEGSETRKLVFSGDLGRKDAPILRDPTPIAEADYVFIESTYGGREHEPEDESLEQLAKAVNDVKAQNGVLLIPAFAIGRTQEVVWALRRLLDAGRISPVRLYLDSPMASKATTIYKQHSDYYDQDSLDLLARGSGPMAYPNALETPLAKQSEAIERAKRPYIVVASNGMLTGGRVLNHLRNLIGDSRAMILFVGYQGEGTLGARLQDGLTSARWTARNLRFIAPSGRSVVSQPTRTSRGSSPGSPTSPGAASRAIPASPAACSSSMAIPTPRRPSNPRSRPSACRPWPRTGISTWSSTDRRISRRPW